MASRTFAWCGEARGSHGSAGVGRTATRTEIRRAKQSRCGACRNTCLLTVGTSNDGCLRNLTVRRNSGLRKQRKLKMGFISRRWGRTRHEATTNTVSRSKARAGNSSHSVRRRAIGSCARSIGRDGKGERKCAGRLRPGKRVASAMWIAAWTIFSTMQCRPFTASPSSPCSVLSVW
jgi:hypothetical protein